MERFVQYLDDVDDFFYTVVLTWERIRNFCSVAIFMAVSLTLQALGVYVALRSPPLALAMATILAVILLYRGAVYYGPGALAKA